MKVCTKCQMPRPLNAFCRDSAKKDGLCSWCRVCQHKYNLQNRDRIQIRNREYRATHKEDMARSSKMWKERNRERVNLLNRKSRAACVDWWNTPIRKLAQSMKNGMRRSLRGEKGGVAWTKLVDYTPQALKKHIEQQFMEGMAWKNYGQWHIDHIRPVCSFSFNLPTDSGFKECWALSNLQPLWAFDNQSKGGRWEV